MIRGSTPDQLLVELRLPIGFEPVDPFDLPPIEDGMRVEIIDLSGKVRPWQWPEAVAWHEAIGFRVAPDGLAEACDFCGRLTHQCDGNGDPLCASCCADGDWEPC